MDIFTNLGWEIWLALGLALFAAEALGASGFLIGAAVAALANAGLVALLPDLSATAQIVVFAITSVIATVVYFQVFQDAQKADGAPPINERAASLIGTTLELETDLESSQRVQIGDTMWKIESSTPIPAGTDVVVVGSNGMTLTVEPRS